jgi:hypothetical protein
MRHDSREERKKCSARDTRVGMGDVDGEERSEGDGRDDKPIPSQSRKNVRRPVAAEDVAMGSQFRKKNLSNVRIEDDKAMIRRAS